MQGTVINIGTVEQLNIIFQKLPNHLIVLDFSAKWCQPCQRLKEDYERLAEQNSEDCIFITIDVDESEELAEEFEILGLPTFFFIKESKLLYKFTGAKLEELIESVEKYRRK